MSPASTSKLGWAEREGALDRPADGAWRHAAARPPCSWAAERARPAPSRGFCPVSCPRSPVSLPPSPPGLMGHKAAPLPPHCWGLRAYGRPALHTGHVPWPGLRVSPEGALETRGAISRLAITPTSDPDGRPSPPPELTLGLRAPPTLLSTSSGGKSTITHISSPGNLARLGSAR